MIITVDVVLQYLIAKMLPTLAGMFGGITISCFWLPRLIRNKSSFYRIFLIMTVSGSMSFTCSGITAEYFSVKPQMLDLMIGIGYIIGLCSFFILNVFANFLIRHEDKDLAQIIKIGRNAATADVNIEEEAKYSKKHSRFKNDNYR